ncbi:MAG TPA: sialate O-acetylesterase [Bacteroidales bacterium]|nr:sialate O-acetylesterase [Bacteroidales bacterium]
MKYFIAIITGFILFGNYAQALDSPDPNFHIYICFGQSNMEGNAAIAAADTIGVSERFKVMTVSAGDFLHNGRSAGNWYTAKPPLCRWDNGLTPADYFGRVLVDSLPDSIKVGVIVVAMGGSGIDAFDKDNYTQYYQNADAWQKGLMDIYGGNPYAKIIEMAKMAQKKGVIKGILLHQGESNNGQTDWPEKVKKIYNNMLADLNIEANSIPLLAGELLGKDEGGICWGMNGIIATLPYYIPNAYAISSKGCAGNGKDGLHFSTEGARELGRHYGLQMLSLLKTYNTVEGNTVDSLSVEKNSYTLLTGSIQRLSLTAIYADGHTLDVANKAGYSVSNPDVVKMTNGYIEVVRDGAAVITASFKGSQGTMKQVDFKINATTFPLTNELLNPNIFSNGSFDETTKTLKTGQWGFGGWQYSKGVDLSGYKYLVAKLGSANKADVEFKLFDGNNYWGASTSGKFGNSRQVVVNLKNVKKGDGSTLEPSHIYIAGFWSNGSNAFVIDTVFLSNSQEFDPTGINDMPENNSELEMVDVYSVLGVKLRSKIIRKHAIEGLPKGVYMVGNKNGYVKVIQNVN